MIEVFFSLSVFGVSFFVYLTCHMSIFEAVDIDDDDDDDDDDGDRKDWQMV